MFQVTSLKKFSFVVSLFAALAGVVGFSAKVHEDDIDFVIDLDNVLVFPEGRDLGPEIEEVFLRMGILVRANKKIYRVAHGAGEFLQSLSHIHGSRISFYSAHARTRRTAEILGQIRLPNGKTAWDISHNILFHSSVIELDFLESAREADFISPWPIFNPVEGTPRQKKDLGRVTWKPNFERMFLIDDAIANALPGQERNLVWSKPEHGPLELARVRGLLDRALDRARRTGISPVEALFHLQWTRQSRKTEHHLEWDQANARDGVIERGHKKMLRENPAFSLDASYLSVFQTRDLTEAQQAERMWEARRATQALAGEEPVTVPIPERESPPVHRNPWQECLARLRAAGKILFARADREKGR